MLTNTGSEQFINGFLRGQMGLDIPEDATEEQKQAYERGLIVREAENLIKIEMYDILKDVVSDSVRISSGTISRAKAVLSKAEKENTEWVK